MIAAMATAMPTMPAEATARINGASSGSRLRRFGIITPGRSVDGPRRESRSWRRASRSAPGLLADGVPLGR